MVTTERTPIENNTKPMSPKGGRGVLFLYQSVKRELFPVWDSSTITIIIKMIM